MRQYPKVSSEICIQIFLEITPEEARTIARKAKGATLKMF